MQHDQDRVAGVEFDVAGLVEKLGPPLDVMLAPYFPGAGSSMRLRSFA